jgi:hypothetical protein
MALLFMDGFDTLSANAPLSAKGWSQSYSTSDTGRFGGRAVTVGTGLAASVTIANTQTVILGFAYKHTTATVGAYLLIRFRDGATTQLELQIDSTSIRAYRGAGTTLLATGSATVAASAWTSLEIKLMVADSGSIVVKLDGVTVLSFSGDTQSNSSAYCNTVLLAGTSSASIGALDDLFLLDTTGSAPLNDYIGDVRVSTLFPTSDSSVAFTPASGGSNYLMVDDGATVDGDTTYASGSSVGDKDLMGFEDLSFTPATVHAVRVGSVARKTDAGVRSLCAVAKSGATELDGTGVGLSTSYAVIGHTYLVDPATSTTWTASAVNSLVAGYKVTV